MLQFSSHEKEEKEQRMPEKKIVSCQEFRMSHRRQLRTKSLVTILDSDLLPIIVNDITKNICSKISIITRNC